MAKRAAYTLAWSVATHSYHLTSQDGATRLSFAVDAVDAPEWLLWLDERPYVVSFAFHGQRGGFTARKEEIKPGSWYWYAYQRSARRVRKKYLGKRESLSPLRLETVAVAFQTGQSNQVNRDASETRSLRDPMLARPNPTTPALAQPILAAKLRAPTQAARRLARAVTATLTQRIIERPLTVFAAPVGFGKSELLADLARQPGLAAAWVTLDAGDNDPARFWTALFSALDTLYPGAGRHTGALARALAMRDSARILTLLLSLLGDGAPTSMDAEHAPGEALLILDDYQTITAEYLHQGLTYLIERLPPRLHLIIATREEPPLDLARLRARDLALEVRADDLRFNREEIAALLALYGVERLTAEDMALLEERTLGWPAGLSLVARALQAQPQRPDREIILRSLSGSQRSMMEYLGQETLARLPAATQRFLLRTAILNQLEGSLCVAVSGQPDAADQLRQLERANLFVTPLDETRRWYRYHPFFSAMLRQRLEREAADEVADLHRCAAQWYRTHQIFEEAFKHARAANDWALIAEILEETGMEMMARGEIQQVMTWVGELPRSLVYERLRLFLFEAWWRWHVGQSAVVAEMLREYSRRHGLPDLDIADVDVLERALIAHVERLYPQPRWSDEQRANRLAEALALYGALTLRRDADAEFSHEACRRAVAHVAGLPHRSRIIQHLTTVALARGALNEAVATMEESVTAGIADGSLTWVTSAGYRLAMLYQQMGELTDVTRVAQVMLSQTEGAPFLTQGSAHIFLGDVAYERNHLDAAAESYHQAIAASAEADLVREVDPYMHLLIGHMQLARICLAQGDSVGARRYVERLASYLQRNWVGEEVLPTARGEYALLMGQLGKMEPGRLWLDDFPIPDEWAPQRELYSLSHRRPLVYARLAIAYQRWDGLESLIADQVALASRQGRNGSLIEWLVQQALLAQARGDTPQALSALSRALGLGESRGYARVFLDAGAPAHALIQRLRVEQRAGRAGDDAPEQPTPSTRYLDQLLSASHHAQTLDDAAPGSAAGPFEPLSQRERDVLALIAEGLSNSEIAARIIIAPSTVKSHVKAIYRKFGASSRTQALARARKARLI